jgi:hypothetical protein
MSIYCCEVGTCQFLHIFDPCVLTTVFKFIYHTLILRWKLPKGTTRERNFFRCRKVPFNRETWILDPPKSRYSESKTFSLKTNLHYAKFTLKAGLTVFIVVRNMSVRILIFIPCIIDYVEINQSNALNFILPYFSFTMAPTCFGKTMPSSGSHFFLSEPLQRQYGSRQVIGHMTEPTYRRGA